jgi:hypothetical protein
MRRSMATCTGAIKKAHQQRKSFYENIRSTIHPPALTNRRRSSSRRSQQQLPKAAVCSCFDHSLQIPQEWNKVRHHRQGSAAGGGTPSRHHSWAVLIARAVYRKTQWATMTARCRTRAVARKRGGRRSESSMTDYHQEGSEHSALKIRCQYSSQMPHAWVRGTRSQWLSFTVFSIMVSSDK